MGGGGWGLHSELTSFEGTRKRPPHVRDLQTLAFWVAACWRFDCITAFPGLDTGSSLHNVADALAFIPILHWIKKKQLGFSWVQFVLSAIHLLWTIWYFSCREFGGKNKSELRRDSCYPPNNSVDALRCSLQCRRLGGMRGDKKENSTIF